MKSNGEIKKKILNKKMVVLVVMLFLFIVLTILTKTHVIRPLDDMVESFVIGIRNDKLTNIMVVITNLSRAYFLISVSIILLFILKNKKHAILVIINLITVFLTSQLLKLIFHRNRPDGEFLVGAKGYSYPSGHAMVSLAYFTLILYFINKRIKNKTTRILLSVITYVLVLFIGLSRIYLGVHYTSDVLAGFILSIAYMMIFLSIINKKEKL